MSKYLVTGGAGFIGANYIQRKMKDESVEGIICLDSLTYAGNAASLASVNDDERFVFVHGDIRDTELVERLLKEHGITTTWA